MSTLATVIVILLTAILSVALMGWIFYAIINRYFKSHAKERMLAMRIDEHRESLRVITPLRLQAYERMSLFLERISPSSLVMRCYKPGVDPQQLRADMTQNIRDEWEHNLSQQVYMSPELWDTIRKAKEEMLSLVNNSAQSIPENADTAALAGLLFATVAKEQSPTDHALQALKKEVQERFE